MITAPALAATGGIRHAFFTRDGGVSHGLFASLNCGYGSADDPAHVIDQLPPRHVGLGLGRKDADHRRGRAVGAVRVAFE